jgi:hypothetical protein
MTAMVRGRRRGVMRILFAWLIFDVGSMEMAKPSDPHASSVAGRG